MKQQKSKIVLLNTVINNNAGFRGSIKNLQPIELLYIYSLLKECYDVYVHDTANGLDFDFSADMYIVSSASNYLFWRCPSLYISNLFELISTIKQKSRKAKILLIGPHGHFSTDDFFTKGVDYILIGEPEYSIKAYVDEIFNSQAKKILFSKECNVNDLPMLNYSLLDNKLAYHSHSYPYNNSVNSIVYESSRGCPYNCVFCNKRIFRGNYREKSYEHIKEEILNNMMHKKIDYIYFIDENFCTNRSHVENICKLMKELKILWGCQTSADSLSYELIDIMASSGCVSLEIGLESASEIILSKNKRMFNLNKTKSLIEYMIEKNISPLIFILFFLPGETAQTLMDTLSFINSIKGKFRISCGIPYCFPNTTLWTMALNQNMIHNVKSWSDIDKLTGRVGVDYNIESEKIKKFCDKYGPINIFNIYYYNEIYTDLMCMVKGE